MYPPNSNVIKSKLVIILIKFECLLFDEINADNEPIIAEINIGIKLIRIAPTSAIKEGIAPPAFTK